MRGYLQELFELAALPQQMPLQQSDESENRVLALRVFYPFRPAFVELPFQPMTYVCQSPTLVLGEGLNDLMQEFVRLLQCPLLGVLV